RGAAEAGAAAAALLSERDPFRRRGPDAPPLDATESDLWDRVAALLDLGDGRPPRRGLQVSAARGVLRVKDSISRQLKVEGGEAAGADEAEALARAVLAAFPDRLARRRDGDHSRLVMVGGRGLRMGRDSGVTEGELLVALDVGAARRAGDEDFVRMASAVPREWIDGGRTRVSTRPVFDSATGRVVGRRREMLGRLVLRESDQPLGRGDDVEAVLAEAASETPFEAFGITSGSDGAAALERLRFLRTHRPELELPAADEAAFRALLPMLVPGARSFADLARRDAVGTFLGLLSHGQRVALEEGAPERLRVPSGSHLRLAYDGERAPVLAVKIQEMFGLADTPTVAGGRVKVLLHLLAPNGRPQQVTDDLASFWSTTYAQVRKDLRGRYPKHPWPEDPLAAEP
ncbi:MAG: ATP-dependent helicase C-terminal domain-containing protein, partial [Planctomycetota bacterium]|nr:ATP-dependent helicase C-terminal domain-containing protein [Planctomycetota bacterium]